MCEVRPSDLVDVFPWSSLAQRVEAEQLAAALVNRLVEKHGNRWLREMSGMERDQVYRWVSVKAAKTGLPFYLEALVGDALYSPFAAARFSLEWQKALERACYGKGDSHA